MGCKNTKTSGSGDPAEDDLSEKDQAAIRRLSWASEAQDQQGGVLQGNTNGDEEDGRSKFGAVKRRRNLSS